MPKCCPCLRRVDVCPLARVKVARHLPTAVSKCLLSYFCVSFPTFPPSLWPMGLAPVGRSPSLLACLTSLIFMHGCHCRLVIVAFGCGSNVSRRFSFEPRYLTFWTQNDRTCHFVYHDFSKQDYCLNNINPLGNWLVVKTCLRCPTTFCAIPFRHRARCSALDRREVS